MGRCGRRVLGAVQRAVGNARFCVFHSSGTVHRLFRRSTTAQDAPGTPIGRGIDLAYAPDCGLRIVHLTAASVRKSVWILVRQLRGPHLSTWA